MIYSINKTIAAGIRDFSVISILEGRIKKIIFQVTDQGATNGADPAASGFSIDAPSGGRVVPFPGTYSEFVNAGPLGVSISPNVDLVDGEIRVTFYNGGANSNIFTLVMEIDSLKPTPIETRIVEILEGIAARMIAPEQ